MTARRDPRLARHAPVVPSTATPPAPPPIAPNVFDIKPLDRPVDRPVDRHVTQRKNVITIDVRPETRETRDPRRGRKRTDERRAKDNKGDVYIDRMHIPDPARISKLPPIPKIPRDPTSDPPPPTKRKRDPARDTRDTQRDTRDTPRDTQRTKRKDKEGVASSPEKRHKIREKTRDKDKKAKVKEIEVDKPAEEEVVAFKELKNYHKERYMRRNKEKSESPERKESEVTEESTSKIIFKMRLVMSVGPSVLLGCNDVTLCRNKIFFQLLVGIHIQLSRLLGYRSLYFCSFYNIIILSISLVNFIFKVQHLKKK